MARSRPPRRDGLLDGAGSREVSPPPVGPTPTDEPRTRPHATGGVLRRGGLWLSLFFLVFSVGLIVWTFVGSASTTGTSVRGPVGPWDWPRGVLALLAVFAFADVAAHAVSAVRTRRATAVGEYTGPEQSAQDAAQPVDAPEADRTTATGPDASDATGGEASAEHEPEASRPNLTKLAVGGALIVGYVIAVPTLGFLIATFLFLLLFIYLGGFRRLLWTPVVAAVATLIVVYLFVKAVYIPLPLGMGPFVGIESFLYHALRLF